MVIVVKYYAERDRSGLHVINPEGVAMQLTSPSFGSGQSIPLQYTCDGHDVNPPLLINEAPTGAQSLVLVVDDPDASLGDWAHWIIWNIPANTSEILENSVPNGSIEGTTDFARTGWGGPCPPSGTHRYHFKLYALDIMLELDSTARKKELEQAMEGHVLDRTELVGVYSRQ